MNIRDLVGSKIVDVEVNVNGYVAIYVEKDGKTYAINIAPRVVDLNPEDVKWEENQNV